MKYLVKFFVVTFFLIISTYASAEQKIAYIDMKFILNNSKAGKGAQNFLQNSLKENQKKFSDKENELKDEEKDILTKKTILTKEEYKLKTDELRKKVVEYQGQRRKALETVTKQRADFRQTLLVKLDPILKKYIKEKNILILMDKKNIILGSVDLDITNIIVEKLNKELPSLDLK